jgi:hypothetical protein
VRKKTGSVGFGVLTAVTIKGTVFWVVKPCIFLEVQRRFGGTYLLHLLVTYLLLVSYLAWSSTLKIEVVYSSEMTVDPY